jgi:SAM-dependent methyltransferase
MKPGLPYEDNPASIKFYVKQFILNSANDIKGKKVVDFPAGNGVTSSLLKHAGAIPLPFDLFPEYFRAEGLECKQADISQGISLESSSVDMLICQEGIEHFTDQLKALQEFSRVIKTGGKLLITTPNYSNIRARLSYLFSESERFGSMMPPNELDSIWMNSNKDHNIYYGHIFLIGAQKLRTLAVLSGFRLKCVHPTKTKSTSLILYPLIYPWIWLYSYSAFRKKSKGENPENKEIRKEIFRLNINKKILTQSHLMFEFEKITNPSEVSEKLKPRDTSFGIT